MYSRWSLQRSVIRRGEGDVVIGMGVVVGFGVGDWVISGGGGELELDVRVLRLDGVVGIEVGEVGEVVDGGNGDGSGVDDAIIEELEGTGLVGVIADEVGDDGAGFEVGEVFALDRDDVGSGETIEVGDTVV